MKAAIHHGVPMAEYLALPAVSAGLLQTLDAECPAAAWHDSWLNPKRVIEISTTEQSVGTIAHGILLEGSIANVAVIDPQDHPAEKTGNIPEGWTNKSIKAARAAAIASGKTPILLPVFAVVREMIAAADAFIESLRTSEPAIYALFQPDGGDSETVITWEDVHGVPCRIRPDRLSKDRAVVVDYKTVSRTAEPNAFGRMIASMGYDVSLALYRRGVAALGGGLPEYVFLVQEQEPPYLCSLVSLEPAYIDFAQRKVAGALEEWAACARAGAWPAYPARVAYVELPPWEATRHEERQAVRGIPYDVGKLWEKPDAIEARAAARAPEYPASWLGPQS